MYNQDPLKTPRVNALDSETLHDGRPSTRPVSFQGKGWTLNGNKATTPMDPPLYRTGVPPMNQSKTARRAGFQGTRNHHQATRTGRLETTLVRRPRVGQCTMPLSTPTLTPLLVPLASPWNYKRGSPGAETGRATKATQHSYIVELPHSIPRLYSPLYKHLGAK